MKEISVLYVRPKKAKLYLWLGEWGAQYVYERELIAAGLVRGRDGEFKRDLRYWLLADFIDFYSIAEMERPIKWTNRADNR
jgi:hypothetical protein